MKKNKINNNWYVITGGPCSGKTTLLNTLQGKGHNVIYEIARTYIDEEMSKGKTLQEIRVDELAFQKKVLQLKIDMEQNLSTQDRIFLERGIHDSVAYYEICNVTDDGYLKKATTTSRYKKVFLLELLDYKKDYARTEDARLAKKIENLLAKSYTQSDIPVLFVPKMPIEERVEFIINNL